MPSQSPPDQYASVTLIVIFLFYLFTTPDQGPPLGFPSPRDYAAERIARSRHALNILNTTKFQDFSPRSAETSRYDAPRYLNLTGFGPEDGFAWNRLDTFKSRSLKMSQEAWGSRQFSNINRTLEGEVYENATGIVSGQWVRYSGDLNGGEMNRGINLTELSPGIDWAFVNEELWTRNITGNEGKLMLRVDEKGGEEMEMSGDLSLKDELSVHSGGLVREVAATMTVQDESSSGSGWEMRVHGVHWPRQGVMLLTTTSEKFAGIFGLPHLTASLDYFSTSQKLLEKTLEGAVERMERASWIGSSSPWSSSPDIQGDATMPVPHCEYVVHVQVHPFLLNTFSKDLWHSGSVVHQIEQELRFPSGAPIGQVPRLQMSTVIFSPDCGFMLESKGPPTFSSTDGEHLVGQKEEMYLHSVQWWLISLAAVIFGQVLLLKVQSKEASTPSTVGRVSLYTVAMMLMADALLFSSLSLLSASAPHIFPSALLASFAALISVALGVRFVGAVYTVQEPERREQHRLQQAAVPAVQGLNTPARPTPSATPTITGAGADVVQSFVPAPGSATANSNPIVVPSDQDIAAEVAERANGAAAGNFPTITIPPPQTRGLSDFAAVYGHFVLLLTVILFLSLSSISWPVPLRTAYTHLLSTIYLSLWVPQIRRNIIRNCRKALLWKFVVGQSVLRLLPFAYFYLKDDNILFAECDWKAFCVLAGWVWVQIWVLVAQEVLGPRWGIPSTWTDDGWDYHPILREDNVEAGGLPIGLMKIPGSPEVERPRTSEEIGNRKKKAGSVNSVDCAICMQVLEVPVVAASDEVAGSSGTGGVAGILARRQYMVTPCRHIFHSACLEGWMRFRLQCPICRENLPPL